MPCDTIHPTLGITLRRGDVSRGFFNTLRSYTSLRCWPTYATKHPRVSHGKFISTTLRCTKWDLIRKRWEPEDRAKRGNLSWALGGKETSDTDKWKSNMEAVKKTVRFALATRRLQAGPEKTTVATQHPRITHHSIATLSTPWH